MHGIDCGYIVQTNQYSVANDPVLSSFSPHENHWHVSIKININDPWCSIYAIISL